MLITIKVETTETEERVMTHLQEWVDENFQDKNPLLEVCGKNKTLKK